MNRTGVVLMTYGSPRDLDDVGAYITRVRGGREPGDELLAEFRRRYSRIGMSPLIDITRRQAENGVGIRTACQFVEALQHRNELFHRPVIGNHHDKRTLADSLQQNQG